MKKIIFLLAFIAVLGTVNAQTPTSAADKFIRADKSWGWFTGAATDTIAGATTADALFQIGWDRLYAITWFVSADTLVGGTGNVTIQPQGSYDGVTFESIGAATTWTYTNGGYDAATQINTYTEVTAAATDYISGLLDSTAGAGNYLRDDTITIAERTTTITLPGYDYRFVKILLTGASGARVELQNVGLKLSEAKLD